MGHRFGLGPEAEAAASAAEAAEEPGEAAYARAIGALAHLREGDIERALSASEHALRTRDALGEVDEGDLEIFLARLLALRQAGQEEAAREVASRAAERMNELAQRIRDETWRARFRRSLRTIARSLGGLDAIEL